MSVVVTDERAPSGPAAGGAARLAHAMATLAAAEQRTGVRRTRTARHPVRAVVPAPAPVPVPVPLPAAQQPLAAIPSPSPAVRVSRELDLPGQHERRLPVHPSLVGLLPGGVLPAGGVLAVVGSSSLLLGLLGAASQEGAWVAFVGAPALGMLAAADAGLELERVALVPAPGADAPTVVAALLDGVDVVVLGPQVALLDSDRRRLAARARERGAVLATTSPWPGAHVSLDARAGSWSGADQGAGWLRRRTLSVLRTGRGSAARPVELDVEVPVVASAAPVHEAPALSAPVTTGESQRRLQVVA